MKLGNSQVDRHGVKVGPGPRDSGPQDSGTQDPESPLKFKSGTWDLQKLKIGTLGPPSKFKSGNPGTPSKFASGIPHFSLKSFEIIFLRIFHLFFAYLTFLSFFK